MLRTENEAIAEKLAQEKSRSFGTCIYDGCYYVGTRDELKAIGVVKINNQYDAAKEYILCIFNTTSKRWIPVLCDSFELPTPTYVFVSNLSEEERNKWLEKYYSKNGVGPDTILEFRPVSLNFSRI